MARCVNLGYAESRVWKSGNLIHVAGFNLGLLMRRLIGVGTPREAAALSAWFLTTQFGGCYWLVLVVIVQDAVGEIRAGAVMFGITQGNR